jgi:predicted dienelactone hydrolase
MTFTLRSTAVTIDPLAGCCPFSIWWTTFMTGVERSRRLRSFRALLISVIALSLSSCGDDANERFGAPQQPLTSAALLQQGRHAVGVTTMNFEDTSRPTMANGSVPGSPSRTLVTEIWYPTDTVPNVNEDEHRDAPLAQTGRPYPLVIYSHGFISMRTAGGFIGRHLASYGYVVASPDFPLTNANAPGGPNVLDVVHQPGDVSFIITQLLALSADAHGVFARAIDAQRIGLTGLSLGGETTYLTAFDVIFRDSRVRAAAPIAGPGCSFGKNFYGATRLPLLILHGDIDAIVPYRANAVLAFSEANPPKYLVTLTGATHTAFADVGGLFENVKNPDDIGCAALLPDLHTGDPETAQAFLEQLGGAAAGIIMGDCPAPCTGPRHGPRAMRPSRQEQLTLLSVFPFFEGYLRNDGRARDFVGHTLAVENTDLTVQSAF